MKIFLRILSAIGLLVWCTCFAFGFDYNRGGALVVGCLLAFFLLLVMGMLLYLMMRWSNPKSTDHKANSHIREIISCILYGIIALVSAGGVCQFITVQTKVRHQVAPIVANRVNELNIIFDKDGTQPEGSYRAYIDTKAYAYRMKVEAEQDMLGLDDYNKESNVETAVNFFQNALENNGTVTFETLRTQIVGENGLNGYFDHLSQNWWPTMITKYTAMLDQKLPEWERQVVELSTNHEFTANEPYQPYVVDTNRSVVLLDKVKGGKFSILGIVVVIILQIIILLAYVAGRNWSKAGPKRPKNDVQFVSWG